MSTVINHNARVRTRVFERCIFYLVRGLCARVFLFTPSAALQQAAVTPSSAPLPFRGVKTSRHLHFIYTSKGPAGKKSASPLLLNISFPFSLFVFSRTAAGLTRPLLSYQLCAKFTLKHILVSPQLTQAESSTLQWQQRRSHVTFWQAIYIIPMVPRGSLLEALPAVRSIYLTPAQVKIESR